jgi:fructose-1,6-bisphosphatase
MQVFFDFGSLREFVYDALRVRADLDVGCATSETLIRKGNRTIAVEFMLYGGRSVRLSAIWELERNRILFYDQTLERFRIMPVQSSLSVQTIERSINDGAATRSLWSAK